MWNTFESKCHAIAKSQKVVPYLIDLLPLDHWLDNPMPAVTNSMLMAPIANQHLLMPTKNSFYGIYHYPYPTEPIQPVKDFNCLINRMDPVRQSWLYQLIRRDIFDRGFVSFAMHARSICDSNNEDSHVIFERQFENHCKIFQTEHDSIKHRVPYKNFHDNGDLTHVIMQSKFSVVLETYFVETHAITFTEKIFRCLQLPRPWLLFAHPHAVKILKNMGFDVCDDVIDHDRYDNNDWWIDRQRHILDLACEMCDHPIDHARFARAAKHNQNLLESFWITCERDYVECVATAAKWL